MRRAVLPAPELAALGIEHDLTRHLRRGLPPMNDCIPPPPPPVADGLMARGLYAWLWPLPTDPARAAADLRALGVRGVIPQQSDDAPAWCHRHAAAFIDAGLEVVVGLGKNNPASIHDALSVPGAAGVMLDWEGWWDGQRALADQTATKVLADHPDAAARIVDCPWWAPLYYVSRDGKRHATHPSAPTREFGRLVRRRFVQAYGANVGPEDGHSSRLLAWARDPSQYASMGAWDIRPAVQMYRRSVRDHVQLLLAELATGAVALWDWSEADAACVVALRVVEALRARGFTGPGAVARFQASASLAADDVVGPRTCAALGVPVPAADVPWSRP